MDPIVLMLIMLYLGLSIPVFISMKRMIGNYKKHGFSEYSTIGLKTLFLLPQFGLFRSSFAVYDFFRNVPGRSEFQRIKLFPRMLLGLVAAIAWPVTLFIAALPVFLLAIVFSIMLLVTAIRY